jgi:hypothetical protein
MAPCGKRDNPILAATLAVLYVAFEAFIAQRNPEHRADDSNAEVAKWTKVVGKWTKWLVVVGLLSVVAVSLQWCTFVESERAQLAVSGARIFDEVAAPITVIVEITNSGRATAKRGQVSYHSRTQSLPGTPDYNNPTPLFFAPIVPGGVLRQGIDVHMSPSELTRTPLFIYGVIHFSDAYTFPSGSKEVGFCLHYRAELKLFETCPVAAYSFAN